MVRELPGAGVTVSHPSRKFGCRVDHSGEFRLVLVASVALGSGGGVCCHRGRSCFAPSEMGVATDNGRGRGKAKRRYEARGR